MVAVMRSRPPLPGAFAGHRGCRTRDDGWHWQEPVVGCQTELRAGGCMSGPPVGSRVTWGTVTAYGCGTAGDGIEEAPRARLAQAARPGERHVVTAQGDLRVVLSPARRGRRRGDAHPPAVAGPQLTACPASRPGQGPASASAPPTWAVARTTGRSPRTGRQVASSSGRFDLGLQRSRRTWSGSPACSARERQPGGRIASATVKPTVRTPARSNRARARSGSSGWSGFVVGFASRLCTGQPQRPPPADHFGTDGTGACHDGRRTIRSHLGKHRRAAQDACRQDRAELLARPVRETGSRAWKSLAGFRDSRQRRSCRCAPLQRACRRGHRRVRGWWRRAPVGAAREEADRHRIGCLPLPNKMSCPAGA